MTFLVIFTQPAFYFSIFRITTPILLAALGALIVDKAGLVNIGLEGTMLFAALCGVLGNGFSGSLTIGLLCAVLGSVLLTMVIAWFTLALQADGVIAGIAINLFAGGGTIFMLYAIVGDRGISSSVKSAVMPALHIPLLKDIPFAGQVLSGQNLLTYLAFLAVPLVYFMIERTVLGLRIRAVGQSAGAASSVGVKPQNVQYIAMLICGVLCGFGGAYMSMGYLSWFTKDMLAGRGFIALAAQAMGGGNAVATMLSSLLFGTADSLANSMQALKAPGEFVQMMPYVVTIIGLSVYSWKMKQRRQRLRKAVKTGGEETV
jgi:simple sugar transport system permease protein